MNSEDDGNGANEFLHGTSQCNDHNLNLPGTFNVVVDNFTFVISEENRFHYATPHAGIPTAYKNCSSDVLEHQILHLVLHMDCKF